MNINNLNTSQSGQLSLQALSDIFAANKNQAAGFSGLSDAASPLAFLSLPNPSSTQNAFLGGAGYLLGSEPNSTSNNSINAFLAMNAINVLSSNTFTNEDKLSALAKIAVQAGFSNEFIDKVQAENINGVIGIADTARNWNELSNAGKINGVAQGVNTLSQLASHIGLGSGEFQIGTDDIRGVTNIVNTIDNWDSLSTGQKITGAAQSLQTALQLGSDFFANGDSIFGGSSFGQNEVNGIVNIANTASNWNDLNDSQRAVGVVNGVGALGNIASSLGFNFGATTASSIGGAAGGALSVVQGVDQAVDLFGDIQDISRSKAVAQGGLALGATGASIGMGLATTFAAFGTAFLPGVGTAIGAAVGAAAGALAGFTGTGKSTGQIMRDNWRDAMESMGVAAKIEGSHHVQLADGSTYNIGADGGHKLQNFAENIDGKTERHTFDVDWSNPLSANSIPDAHLFAIATGLDPVNAKDHGLFDRAVGQALNAATSNASSLQDVKANFRAMMSNIDPQALVGRLQQLQAASIISEESMQVYVNHLAQMYSLS